MSSVTFTIPDEIKAEMKRFSWVNWSKLVQAEASEKISRDKALKKALRIVSKSTFTEKDADEMSDKVKRSMLKRLQKEGLL
ncbi:MAG: hypothetical protein NT038_07365 [Euryarchaeota archaeon]|nr:hypothetical protein [Euryarchaeota archaeon]